MPKNQKVKAEAEKASKMVTEKPDAPKRFASRFVGGGGGFGDVEKVDKTDIDGVEVILVDFMFANNKFKLPDATHPNGYERAIVLIEVDGEQNQCSFSGEVVVEGLKKAVATKETDLPTPVIFKKVKTKDGKKTYWTMA